MPSAWIFAFFLPFSPSFCHILYCILMQGLWIYPPKSQSSVVLILVIHVMTDQWWRVNKYLITSQYFCPLVLFQKVFSFVQQAPYFQLFVSCVYLADLHSEPSFVPPGPLKVRLTQLTQCPGTVRPEQRTAKPSETRLLKLRGLTLPAVWF